MRLQALYSVCYVRGSLCVRFQLDHSSDESLDILQHWERRFGSQYRDVFVVANTSSPPLYEDEASPADWSPKRHERVIELREDSLDFARKKWADYVFMLDADVVFTEPDTLKILVEKNLPIVAPMLLSHDTYSNFWCGITAELAYARCPQYEALLERRPALLGCRAVPLVHSAVLSSLRHRHSDRLTYEPRTAARHSGRYSGPAEDVVVFSVTADDMHVPTFVCNTHAFGFVPRPPEPALGAALERENFLNVKLEAIGRGAPLPLRPELRRFVVRPALDTLGVSKIYMINLRRRPERRALMEASFRELGLDVEVFPAVDSRTLNMNELREMNVKLMPGYEDPYHKRPIKAGEIACMLSHYRIWQAVVSEGHALAVILEDDVRFAPYFRLRFEGMMRELKNHKYDLIYLGRKILLEGAERPVTAHTTKPMYSYWTLGYAVTLSGARKLLAGRPLQNLLPVDEYLPIMFDQHPRAEWKEHFPKRDLNALSASPLLVSPVLYTGMPGYVSDTEDSPVVDPDLSPLLRDL